MPPKKAEAGKPSKKTELKKKEKVIEVRDSDLPLSQTKTH